MICPHCQAEFSNSSVSENDVKDELLQEEQIFLNEKKQFGIIALLIPLIPVIHSICFFIFRYLLFSQGYKNTYQEISYRISSMVLYAIWYAIPIIITVKCKVDKIKNLVILVCLGLFLYHLFINLGFISTIIPEF